MKTLLLSAGFATTLAFGAISTASAAPVATPGAIAAPAGVTNVACRTVERTTVRNGVRRTVSKRECSDDRVTERRVYRSGYRDRYRDDYPRRRDRPGLSINIR